MDRDRKDSEDSITNYVMESSSDKDDSDDSFVLENVIDREEMVIVDKKPRKTVSFLVNGQTCTVGRETPPWLRLSHYLRETLHLTGTKVSCGEGGCGACVVTASIMDPVSQTFKHKAVNSCLIPVLSCDGWEITTVEHLGGRRKGYHPLQAAVIACTKLKQQMKPIKDEMKNPDWLSLVKRCFMAGVDLTARHMGHSSRDNLLSYDIWAAVVTEVELDVLSGATMIHRLDLLEDTGMAISPSVDVGQVEGGVVMGLGLWTSEQLRHHPDTGALLDNNTWWYKVPAHWDIPVDMRIGFYDSGNNPYGVLGSKATGEPSILAGCSVLFAVRQAVKAARKDGGMQGWFRLDGPATVENIKKAINLNPDRFRIT